MKRYQWIKIFIVVGILTIFPVRIPAEELRELDVKRAVCGGNLEKGVVPATGQGTDTQQIRSGPTLFLEPLGATIRRITRSERRRFNLLDQQGVAVAFLCPKSPLVKVFIEVDDILLSINRQIIDSLQKLKRWFVAVQSGKRIALFGIDHRSGKRGYVMIETLADKGR